MSLVTDTTAVRTAREYRDYARPAWQRVLFSRETAIVLDRIFSAREERRLVAARDEMRKAS